MVWKHKKIWWDGKFHPLIAGMGNSILSFYIHIFHKKILQNAVCLQAKRTSTNKLPAGKTYTCKSSDSAYPVWTPSHSCGTMVSILLCQILGSTFVASHCNMALAICIALLNKLLAGLLMAQTNHIYFGFNASHSTHDVFSQLSESTAL